MLMVSCPLAYTQVEVRQWIFNRMLLPLQDTGKVEKTAMVGIVLAAKPGSKTANRMLLKSHPLSVEGVETQTIAWSLVPPVVNGSNWIGKTILTRYWNLARSPIRHIKITPQNERFRFFDHCYLNFNPPISSQPLSPTSWSGHAPASFHIDLPGPLKLKLASFMVNVVNMYFCVARSETCILFIIMALRETVLGPLLQLLSEVSFFCRLSGCPKFNRKPVCPPC